jgi:hypothetical protein
VPVLLSAGASPDGRNRPFDDGCLAEGGANGRGSHNRRTFGRSRARFPGPGNGNGTQSWRRHARRCISRQATLRITIWRHANLRLPGPHRSPHARTSKTTTTSLVELPEQGAKKTTSSSKSRAKLRHRKAIVAAGLAKAIQRRRRLRRKSIPTNASRPFRSSALRRHRRSAPICVSARDTSLPIGQIGARAAACLRP